jgi:hypothetical protein
MIAETELREALSTHIARAITEARTNNKMAYAVVVYDAGICPFAAFALARDYIESTARESGYGDDEARICAEEARSWLAWWSVAQRRRRHREPVGAAGLGWCDRRRDRLLADPRGAGGVVRARRYAEADACPAR